MVATLNLQVLAGRRSGDRELSWLNRNREAAGPKEARQRFLFVPRKWGRAGRPPDCSGNRLLKDADTVVDGTLGNPSGQQDATSRGGHPRHLSRSRQGIGSEDHGEYREHDVCTGSRDGYRCGVALDERGTDAALCGSGTRNVEKPGRRVNAGGYSALVRSQERGISGAADDVDNPVTGRDSRLR
jgi:hypothetical protein